LKPKCKLIVIFIFFIFFIIFIIFIIFSWSTREKEREEKSGTGKVDEGEMAARLL
jgi:heme/copper-type cytochrome/quinol oxidase subunit 2